MRPRRNKGFTLIELLVVVAIIALLISILLPSLGRARQLAKRAVCAANLKGIGNSMNIYAASNTDSFPIVPHEASTAKQITFVEQIGASGAAAMSGVTCPPTSDAEKTQIDNFNTTKTSELASVTSCLWLLVREGGVSPKSFNCPESSEDEEDNTEGLTCYWDFTGYNTVSYGYMIPWKRLGTDSLQNPVNLSTGIDVRIALVADKGPMAKGGGTWGTSASKQEGLKDLKSAQGPRASGTTGYGTGEAKGQPGYWPDTRPGNRADKPEFWQPWNSPNHGGRDLSNDHSFGQGQNVLYPDAHTEWSNNPNMGADNDNIYTIGHSTPAEGAGQDPAVSGGLPGMANANDTFGKKRKVLDSVIYP